MLRRSIPASTLYAFAGVTHPLPDMADVAPRSLSLEDQQRFDRFSYGPRVPAPFSCVHHAFEYHAATQPNATAVEHLGDSITYAELDRQANILANYLRTSGVRPGVRICLLVQRSILMVVGIVAVLKAGGAYVPLDGTIVTQSTLEHVLNDSEAKLVLTLQDYVHRVSNTPTFCLENIAELPQVVSKPEDLSASTDSVYIIYTSGKSSVDRSQCVVLGSPGMLQEPPASQKASR